MLSFGILVLSLALALGVGYFGRQVAGNAISTWYAGLNKPRQTPPDSWFMPVWTALYILMAVAAWLVWRVEGSSWAIGLYFLQLVLNAGWCYVFYGLRRPGFALAEMSLLWAAIVVTMLSFWSFSIIAGVIFAVYLVWVTFAWTLNWGIFILNRPEHEAMKQPPAVTH
jgi:tryptophan-rich sensory protein